MGKHVRHVAVLALGLALLALAIAIAAYLMAGGS